MKLYNFDEMPIDYEKRGSYGGNAGNKDAIIWNGSTWLIKFPKSTKSMNVTGISYTTSPLSEYIGSHIYEMLGFDVHQTEMGFKNNKLVVACKDFTIPGDVFKEIRTVKNLANDALAEELDRSFSETGDDHKVNLEELLLHLYNNDILSRIDPQHVTFEFITRSREELERKLQEQLKWLYI